MPMRSSPERYINNLHDYASGEITALLYRHTDAVLALAFSPTGRWLASAGKDHTVRVWDLVALQGSSLAEAPLVHTAHTDHIYDLAWSALGDRLASVSYDGTVGLWNAEALVQGILTLMARLQGHDDQVLTVAFHLHGTVLASAGKDRTIRTWRAADGKPLGVLVKAKHKVAALAFSNKIAKYVSAEHLRDRFYRPAFLQAKLQEDRQFYSTVLQHPTVFQQ